MSKVIANPKTYTGQEIETIFLRPSFSGPGALDLGVRMLYNMPVPTTLNFWSRSDDVLKKYQGGFQGGSIADKFQKTISLEKLKVEMAYSPEDYFGMIYEKITNSANVNLQDLSGTELEAAETALLREAIAESLRITMWLGDKSRTEGGKKYNTFDGFIKRIKTDIGADTNDIKKFSLESMEVPDAAETLFKKMFREAPLVLQESKDQGNLVYLVTSDVYNNYEDSLDDVVLETAYAAKQNGRTGLRYRGIPVIDVKLSGILPALTDMPQSFVILTDRRNLAMAVNTNDFPGSSVDLWYSKNDIQNRQRAVFMAGCDYLLPELIVAAFPAENEGA